MSHYEDVTHCEDEHCGREISPMNDDSRYSTVTDKWYCWGCYEMDMTYASRIVIIEPYPLDRYEDRMTVTVGDLFIEDMWGEEPDIDVTRTYHRTDGWRGYNETRIAGWSEVTSGWTTGNWGDYIGQRKATFNEWAQALSEGEIVPPVRVAIIADPTSNVFSTAIGVWVKDEDVDTFTDWLGEGMLEDLEEALG